MSVFKMDKNFEVVLNKDAVKLVPELSTLTQDELKYVILVADYVDGPYRKKPIDERRLMAKKNVYGAKKTNAEPPKIKNALAGYKSLVFDIRRETIDVYKQKIKRAHKDSLAENTTTNELKAIDTSISFLTSRIESIQKDLDLEEMANLELKAGRQLSQIEIWQRNQKAHKEFNS